jgi:hypothetical protein
MPSHGGRCACAWRILRSSDTPTSTATAGQDCTSSTTACTNDGWEVTAWPGGTGEGVGFDEHAVPGREKRLQATAARNALGDRGTHHGKGGIPAPNR